MTAKEYTKRVDKERLKAQYQILSELEGMFPNNSKHKVFKEIDTRMRSILVKIQKIK